MAVKVSKYLAENYPDKFVAQAKLHPSGTQSLKNLQNEGVDRHAVIRFLLDYTRPDSVRQQRVVRNWAGDMAKLLAKARQIVAQTERRFSEGPPDVLIAQTAFESSHCHQQRKVAGFFYITCRCLLSPYQEMRVLLW
jgi:hypothetical protein